MSVDFLIGGLAASGAACFTNPLEVAKTRMQLQGELAARGRYVVHYRNVFHAFYTVGRVEGLTALQKGLTPALWYQFVMNGVRLGINQRLIDAGLTRDAEGRICLLRSVAAGAMSGCLGASAASPLYLIKTHLQAEANASIAVGHQHHHQSGMRGALVEIYRRDKLRGLWRGASGAMSRVAVGSATQLSTFSYTKEYVATLRVFPAGSWLNAFSASMLSGVVVVVFMTPFDVVSTRLYNQGTDSSGRGLLYRGLLDCFCRIFAAEGVWGFYKGWGASMFRLAPHTILSLMFWNQLQVAHRRLDKTLHILGPEEMYFHEMDIFYVGAFE